MKNTYKAITLMIALLLIGSASYAQSLSGDYTVGTSPGADFSSLHAAVDAAKTEGISGDVRFLIATDLNEAQNIFLGLDTDGNTLTIRPAAGTTPTITFTAEANNSGAINGALVIGATSDDWDSLIETRNIIIDGSNTEGGTSRDLTITTLSTTGTSNYVRILGSSRDVTIRNTNISMKQLSFDTVLISPVSRNETEWVPQDVTLENNLIQSNLSRTSSRAVNVWAVTGFDAIETAPGPINIIGNDIEARRYGIWLRLSSGNTTIEDNRVTITEAGTLQAYAILVDDVVDNNVEIAVRNNQLRGSAGGDITMIDLNATARYTIEGNQIDDVAAGVMARGIAINKPLDVEIRGNLLSNFKGGEGIEMIGNASALEGPVNVEMINNRLTGFSSEAASGQDLFGVVIRSNALPDRVAFTMYHNTIVLNPISIDGTGWNYRGMFVFSNPRIDLTMRNNIFVNNDDNDTAVTSYIFYQAGSAAANLDSDFNVFGGSDFDGSNQTWLSRNGAVGTNTVSLSDFQTQSSGDALSKQLTPEFDADLRLTGTSNGSADLIGTPLASVTTDAFGTARSTTAPTMGAFESSLTAPQLTVTGDAGWRMMSSPVTNFTVAQFANQTAVQGVPGLTNAGFPANIYTGYDGTQWTSPASGSDVLTSGRGFITFFFNNNVAGSQELPITITAPGASPLTDVTVAGLHNNGDRWNLLGNPFPYAVNVADISANGGISAHGQVWVDGEGTTNGSGSVNGSWIPTSAEPFNGQIAPWQGVMMQTTEDNPATSVTFPASSADSESELAFQRELPVRSIQFRLKGQDLYNGQQVVHPATMLYMHPEATEGADQHDLDLLAPIGNGTVLLYWVARDADQTALKIQNSIPYDVTEPMLFDLDVFSYGPSGTFTLDWPYIAGLSDEGLEFILTDNLTGESTDLMSATTHTFALDERLENAPSTPWDKDSGSTPRFTLRVSPATGTSVENTADQPLAVSLSQNFPNPFNPTTTIAYSIVEQGMVTLTVYDVTGRRVATLVNQVQSPGQYTASFNAASLSSGLYLYRLQTGGTSLTQSMTLIK